MTEHREIGFSRQFTLDFKRLRKTYRQVDEDLRPLLEQLKQGETPGEQIPGVGRPVYKVRLTNRSAKSGKRGGFRVLYYIQTDTAVYLMTIYAKNQRENISASEIKHLLDEVDESMTKPSDDE